MENVTHLDQVRSKMKSELSMERSEEDVHKLLINALNQQPHLIKKGAEGYTFKSFRFTMYGCYYKESDSATYTVDPLALYFECAKLFLTTGL